MKTAMKMPETARRVAEILRRDVCRPRHLPVGSPLRFDMVRVKRRSLSGHVVESSEGWSCPMGLHPECRGRNEPYGIPFGEDGEAFGDWWDAQTNAKAAVEAVWGDKS